MPGRQPQKIIKYKASDGTEFTSEKQARLHEVSLELDAFVDTNWSGVAANRAIKEFIAHARTHVKLLPE
jgi:acyl carrier protein phosphodiesterase